MSAKHMTSISYHNKGWKEGLFSPYKPSQPVWNFNLIINQHTSHVNNNYKKITMVINKYPYIWRNQHNFHFENNAIQRIFIIFIR